MCVFANGSSKKREKRSKHRSKRSSSEMQGAPAASYVLWLYAVSRHQFNDYALMLLVYHVIFSGDDVYFLIEIEGSCTVAHTLRRRIWDDNSAWISHWNFTRSRKSYLFKCKWFIFICMAVERAAKTLWAYLLVQYLKSYIFRGLHLFLLFFLMFCNKHYIIFYANLACVFG